MRDQATVSIQRFAAAEIAVVAVTSRKTVETVCTIAPHGITHLKVGVNEGGSIFEVGNGIAVDHSLIADFFK